MNGRKRISAAAKRASAALVAASAQPSADADRSTPYQRLLRAAESGQFETLVAEAQPAEPAAMVTAQEREAGLRASGQWPAETAVPPGRKPLPPAEPVEDPFPGPRYPPSQYVYAFWRPRDAFDERDVRPAGRCVHEYDPFAEFDEE